MVQNVVDIEGMEVWTRNVLVGIVIVVIILRGVVVTTMILLVILNEETVTDVIAIDIIHGFVDGT